MKTFLLDFCNCFSKFFLFLFCQLFSCSLVTKNENQCGHVRVRGCCVHSASGCLWRFTKSTSCSRTLFVCLCGVCALCALTVRVNVLYLVCSLFLLFCQKGSKLLHTLFCEFSIVAVAVVLRCADDTCVQRNKQQEDRDKDERFTEQHDQVVAQPPPLIATNKIKSFSFYSTTPKMKRNQGYPLHRSLSTKTFCFLATMPACCYVSPSSQTTTTKEFTPIHHLVLCTRPLPTFLGYKERFSLSTQQHSGY